MFIPLLKESLRNSLNELNETNFWIPKHLVQGGLHKMLHISPKKHISTSELEKDIHSHNPKLRHRAQFALNVRK